MTTLRYTKNCDKKGLYTAVELQSSSSHAVLETQQIKTVVVGDAGVGKSTLLQTYERGKFADFISFGGQFLEPLVRITLDATEFYFHLWDTNANEEYAKLRPLSYQVAEIFWLCYSVDNRDSFDNAATKWLPEVRQHKKSAPVVLVGMKTDLRSENEKNSVRKPSDAETGSLNLGKEVASRLADDQPAEDLQSRGAAELGASRGCSRGGVTHAEGLALRSQMALAAFAECSAKSGAGMEDLKTVTARAFKHHNEARARRRCVVL